MAISLRSLDNKFTRWDENIHGPEQRCEGVGKNGPCPFLAIEGARGCLRHNGRGQQLVEERKNIRNYQIQRWQKRINNFADNDQIKSLREEVGIARLLLEETLNKCENQQELLLYSHKISQLVALIEKLVVSCDKLENRMGMLLSKTAVIQLASQYVTIITEHVDDPETLEVIGTKIMEVTQEIEDPRMMGAQEQRI